MEIICLYIYRLDITSHPTFHKFSCYIAEVNNGNMLTDFRPVWRLSENVKVYSQILFRFYDQVKLDQLFNFQLSHFYVSH